MELFLVLQILDPKYPSYGMGLIIGIGVIHSFVQAGEKKEKEIADKKMYEDKQNLKKSKTGR